MTGQAAAARRAGVETSFEVYVRKGGRWIVRDVFPERALALVLARQLVSQKEFEAVKVVRDQLDLTTGESSERVIYDDQIRIAPAPPPAKSAPPERATARPEPDIRRRTPAPQPKDFPWLALVTTVLGLSVAAFGFWFITAIY